MAVQLLGYRYFFERSHVASECAKLSNEGSLLKNTPYCKSVPNLPTHPGAQAAQHDPIHRAAATGS